MSSKTVFIFRHYAAPPGIPGGRRHYNIARAMGDEGHAPYIFLSNFNHVNKNYARRFPGLYEVENVHGVNFVWINNCPAYSRNDWRRLVGMLDYSVKAFYVSWRLARLGRTPDVVIGSVAHIFAVLSAYLVGRIVGARFWMDIGDLWLCSWLAYQLFSIGGLKR